MPEDSDRSFFTDTLGWQSHARDAYHHLSIDDKELLDCFIAGLSAKAREKSPRDAHIMNFLVDKGIELNVLTEKGGLVIVLFLEFFRYLEHVEKVVPKYDSLSKFISAYEKFSGRSPSEQNTLWRTANWVATIMQYIPAKKNKGLIICIVPKYVQGLQTRYVTGSGQTAATNDRVFIYEVEGAIVRAHRQAPKRPRSNAGTDDDCSVASGSVCSVTRPSPVVKTTKPKKRSTKALKPLLDEDNKFKFDADGDILNSDSLITDDYYGNGLKIVAPEEGARQGYRHAPDITPSSFYDRSVTPVGDDASPYLKRTKLTRDITWGIDINKKAKEDESEEGLYGLPPPHRSYHYAGESIVTPYDLCRPYSK